jgi:hypothetical protein
VSAWFPNCGCAKRGERTTNLIKLRSPYFVSAELLKDGSAKLVDDDGEVYSVEMRRELEYPLIARLVRRREMRATGEALDARERQQREPDAPTLPFKPWIVS